MTETLEATVEEEQKETVQVSGLIKPILILAGTVGSESIMNNACKCFSGQSGPLIGLCEKVGRYAIAGMVTGKAINWLDKTVDQTAEMAAEIIVGIKERQQAKEEEEA